ncbi:SNF2-related protein [Ottowia beijingensis]|uniref:SNF2-related protein n=2 Tax=Ottowia beijingensis TaxID=1207057 RepID=UPI003641F3CD
MLVNFFDGSEDFFLPGALEKVDRTPQGPYEMILHGRFGRVHDLRGAITYYRLSGKLANLIYSLNSTNTQFLAYQFKPVLQFLDSPSNGILIADEVGLGKTIEAGLIWTELRARQDARRLLVACPAMLCEKWRHELNERFGVRAEIVNAGELLARLEKAVRDPHEEFALIASLQGIRPPRDWDETDDAPQSGAAKLARFLDDADFDDAPLDLVIIDEAHYLRNRETKTHRLGEFLRSAAQNMVMLSATPIQLHNRDLFNLLHLLDKESFPFEWTFEWTLEANVPMVRLRDRVLNSVVSQAEFLAAVEEALGAGHLDDNEQLAYLQENPPSDAVLASARGRAEIADRLDRINPLSKIITRTLKRDVNEHRVERYAEVVKATMAPVEARFYTLVTDKVREFCENLEISEGFMLTIPQRQMASSMAAACAGWRSKLTGESDREGLAETAYELDADEFFADRETKKDGVLLRELAKISAAVGDSAELSRHDSKYRELTKRLSKYWKEYPGRKVVLFTFYKQTLYYLAERLKDDGITSIVLHGGMDKHDALARFEKPDGANILLSTEVASEGVDLQFSSLLINYDLPWNPAKIEQRIGRIDRIGQQAERILIWNMVYADTIDERVQSRLMQRLDTFRNALGSMEAVLGEEIRKLGYELLSHRLTAAEERDRVDRAAVAIETRTQQELKLEEEASNLIAHGEFITNKVRAANELGRYIRGDDLLAYVRDFLKHEFEGTRLIAAAGEPLVQTAELSIDAKQAFGDFLQAHRLQSRTALLSSKPPLLRFDNKVGGPKSSLEIVSQDHPLVRFVSERIKATGGDPRYLPVAAVQLESSADAGQPPDIYVYTVMRWSVSGSRELERLEYVAKSLHTGRVVEGSAAERLVNVGALQGREWLGATGELDTARTANLQDECREILEREFKEFVESTRREDADRIRFNVSALRKHLDDKMEKYDARIRAYTHSADPKKLRMRPAEEKRKANERQRIEERIALLELKAKATEQSSLVSAGVIKVV